MITKGYFQILNPSKVKCLYEIVRQKYQKSEKFYQNNFNKFCIQFLSMFLVFQAQQKFDRPKIPWILLTELISKWCWGPRISEYQANIYDWSEDDEINSEGTAVGNQYETTKLIPQKINV